MKLRAKILLPPGVATLMMVLLTAAALALMWQLNQRVQGASQQALARQQAALDARAQLNAAHAQAYRTLSWTNNLNKDELLAARQQVRASVEQAAALLAGEPAGAGARADTGAQLQRFAKPMDRALELSAIDPNDGLTQMRDADRLAVPLAAEVDSRVAHSRRAAELMAQSAQEDFMRMVALMAAALVAAAALWVARGRHLRLA